MRIVHYHRNIVLAKGGVVRMVLDLCGALARRGHEVTLVTPDATDVPGPWRGVDGPVRVVELGAPRGAFDRLGRGQVRRAADAIRSADAMHLHGVWMPSNCQVAAAARGMNVPYALSPHGMLDDWSMSQSTLRKRVFHAIAAGRMLRGASAIHCTARAELEQARKWTPGGIAGTDGRPAATVIPPLVDLAAVSAPAGAPAAHDGAGGVVLFLSRLHHKKGVDVLIDACRLLAGRGVNHRLVIAGSGDEAYRRRLEELAAPLGSGVEFAGLVTGEAKRALYGAASVFCLPTSQENFGIVLAEAAAAGLPLVTTRGTDIWEELESGGGTLIVDRTADAVAAGLEKLLRDPDLRGRMGRSAREHVVKWLDGDSIVASFESMYADLAGREQQGSTAG